MEIFAGVLGMVLVAVLLILALFWIIFPWMVYSKLSRLEKQLAIIAASNERAAQALETE